ncbi:MAG: hypothetical protein RPU60_12900 [Candidatus Sedimenticola sp. (ex Thyasira tokunagai)]
MRIFYLIAIPVILFIFYANFVGFQPPTEPLPGEVVARQFDGMQLADGKLDEYKTLAAGVGLDYDKVYRYQEYADVTREHEIGIAGAYEFLFSDPGIEVTYYSNYDLTIVRQIRDEGDRSFVKLLKLAKGRVPDLHLL